MRLIFMHVSRNSFHSEVEKNHCPPPADLVAADCIKCGSPPPSSLRMLALKTLSLAAIALACPQGLPLVSAAGNRVGDAGALRGGTGSARAGPCRFRGRSPAGTVRNPSVKEASGCANSRAYCTVLWTHNDAGSQDDRLYAIDASADGRVVSENRLVADGRYVEGVDFEDISIAPGDPRIRRSGDNYIYIADVGDNDEIRTSISIYRFPEPYLPPQSTSDKFWMKSTETLIGDSLELVYPYGGQFDAEAMMYDPFDGHLYIVTKGTGDVFQVPWIWWEGSHGPWTLVWVGKVRSMPGGRITGAEISPNGSEILLRCESRWIFAARSFFYAALPLPPSPPAASPHHALTSRPRRPSLRSFFPLPVTSQPCQKKAHYGITYYERQPGQALGDVLTLKEGEAVPYTEEPQGEAVCFAADGSGYYTLSEGVNEPIFHYERC